MPVSGFVFPRTGRDSAPDAAIVVVVKETGKGSEFLSLLCAVEQETRRRAAATQRRVAVTTTAKQEGNTQIIQNNTK